MPPVGPRKPIQLAAVPRKFSVALYPAVAVVFAPPTGGVGTVASPPPLQPSLSSAWAHVGDAVRAGVNTTAGSVSCRCDTTGAGATNASTTTVVPDACAFL